MNRPLAAMLDALRPGRVEARKARDDVRELNRVLLQMEERTRKETTRREQKLTDSLAAMAARLEETTRELRAVQDKLANLSLRESQVRAVVVRDAELEDLEPTLTALLTKSGTAEHVAAAIEAAELRLDPFPYMVVDGLLPDALYDAVITGLPPAELFGDKPVNKQQLKVPFEFAPAYARKVWRYVTDVVAPQFITPAIVEKFREPLTEWMHENFPSLGEDPLRGSVRLHSTDGRIMLRRRGYCIPPHRDPKWGFVTCLIYLARPDDSETWGTQIFSVASDREARNVAPHWIDPSTCTLVENVAFKRNRSLVFLNSVGAHGASIPADAEPADLERYLYQFRIGPTRAAMKALTEMLPEERRAMWSGKFADY